MPAFLFAFVFRNHVCLRAIMNSKESHELNLLVDKGFLYVGKKEGAI